MPQLVTMHIPILQACELLGAAHTLPHLPQFDGSANDDASHPSPIMPLQSTKPSEQEPTRHMPARQAGEPLGTAWHRTLHAPQLFTSLFRSLQPLAMLLSQSA